MRIPMKALIFASATTLAIAPVAAQSAASLSPSRASAAMSGENDLDGGFLSSGAIFGAIGAIAVLVAVVYTIADDDDNSPVSP
ncbi:hypothetical protein SAMN06295910_2311 [Allosphingosinicella indica]|uniref:Uncharacterized protein n=2 Tax=Allosphingosinicella indica TaxID=941907 RepID=A0A1X7GWU9_9SPHN|nr:hypothetical protein SAMN06295910_2311 [Allosphingosinicella indica]